MVKLAETNAGTLVRGDSSVWRWTWKRQMTDGSLQTLSLKGYKVAFTVKSAIYDAIEDDSTAASGHMQVLFRQDIDCDNPADMHNIDPDEGYVLLSIPKKSTWVAPGQYYYDIVVENKASHRTQTVFYGKLEIQGHPTNRFTTDNYDTFEDLGE